MTVTLMWGLIFMGLGCAIHRIQPTNSHAGSWQYRDWRYGYNNNGEMPYGGDSVPTDDHMSYHDTTHSDPSEPVVPVEAPVPPASTTTYESDDMPTDHTTTTQMSPPRVSQEVRCKMFLQMALLFLLTILIGMPALAGMFVAVFNAMRTNGPIKYKDFFSCFCCRYYCRLIPLSLTLKVLTGILSIMIIPGIWFGFVTIFAVPLHREHKFLGTCRSIRVSMKIVHRYFCNMLGFIILNSVLQVAGFFMFGVGLLFTIPLSFVALCYCYNDLIGVNGMPLILSEPLPGIGVSTVV